MPRKRKGRPISGVLLLNKPTGASSNNILQKVRWIYQAAKAGHTGSLDPLASGMLPICFGEATKFSQFLLNSDKAYRVTAKLGETTTTADAEGDILQTRRIEVSSEEIEQAIMSFVGESMQIPSMFSALKHNGTPLYKLARQGIEVERKARPINIFKIEIESISHDSFAMYVECSKGTYIRNLVEDIGETLGCGAHVSQLHRDWVGHFRGLPMIELAQLEQMREQQDFQALDQLLLATDSPLDGYPSIELSSDAAHYFSHGQALTMSKLPDQPFIKVYNDTGQFLGVASVNEYGKLAPKRLVVITG
ncbi:MAG: tRNA pseudouridine(55) synthase TruB [Kangiellaceae bacterium]|jgi:tRNA pseudouridine55 synthase|nr:tRNA pseudouridine(55) synthase TruB [Kangiellaceae bacterium]